MKSVKANNEMSTKKYWQQHIKACDESNQKKSIYCRDHQLNYDQMMYWQKILKKDKAVSFVPVKMKKDHLFSNERCICTLTMSSGCMLKIYDEKALTIILDKWR